MLEFMGHIFRTVQGSDQRVAHVQGKLHSAVLEGFKPIQKAKENETKWYVVADVVRRYVQGNYMRDIIPVILN